VAQPFATAAVAQVPLWLKTANHHLKLQSYNKEAITKKMASLFFQNSIFLSYPRLIITCPNHERSKDPIHPAIVNR
jgi:hypothetical protein